MAAVLLLFLARRGADWCLGVATDPYRFHAWLEVDGHPVATEPGYVSVLTL